MSRLSSLSKGVFASLTVNLIGLLAVFTAQVVLARALSLEEFGTYSLAIAYLTVLIVVGCFGLDATLLRLVPELIAKSRFGELRGLLRHSSAVVVGFSSLLALTSAIVISKNTTNDSAQVTCVAAAILLPVLCLNQMRQAVLRGLNCVVAARVPDVIVRPAILIVLVVLMAQSFGPLSASMAMVAHLLAALMALLLGSMWQYGKLPEALKSVSPTYPFSSWYQVSFSLLGIGALTTLGNEIDKMVIGALTPSEGVGLYSAANRLAYFAMFGVDTVLALGAPMLASRYATDGNSGLAKLIRQLNRQIFILSVPIIIVIFGAGAWLLSIFGVEFVLAYPTLLVLTAVYSANIFFGPVGFVLNMTGGHRHTLTISLLALLLEIPMVAAGTILFGVNGAAAAVCVIAVFRNFLLYRRCRRELEVDTRVLSIFAKD